MHTRPLHGEWVGHEFVRHNHVYVVADIFFDVLGECASLYILSMEKSELATALSNADHGFLGLLPSADTPTDFLSTNVGFVYFDRSRQFFERRFLSHRVSDA